MHFNEIQHWSKPKISGEKPPRRYSHTTCYIAGPLTGQQYPLLMVVGGHGDQGALSDVWLLDVDKWLWTEVSVSSMLVFIEKAHVQTVSVDSGNM